MKRFMDFRKRTSKNFLGVQHGNVWGDWLALDEITPMDYIDTVYYAHSAKLMSDMARAIGREKDATDYAGLFENIKAAFNKKYVKRDGELTVNTQTGYALALYMNLLADDVRTNAGARLEKIICENNFSIATGILGTRALLSALSTTGHHDLAVRLLQSRKYPSWGYEVEQGATSVWERWDGFIKEKGFEKIDMNSFAHCSFGAICEWMFYQMAGIDTDGAGFKHIVIRPSPPSPNAHLNNKPISWVKAHYDSIRGRIISNWKWDEDRFELEVTIPANTTATVYLPADDNNGITEGGRVLKEVLGVKFLRAEGNRAVLAVRSGKYSFRSTLNRSALQEAH
jgi:alpha-L-rhamnosidase